MTYEPQLGEQLVRSQDGTDLLVRRHGPRNRHAAIRSGEDGPWLPATYEDLLDFILGERAPAEEPREVVEPKSAVGLAVEELRRREVVEPAPAPARWRCEGCGWEGTEAELATSNGHADIGRDANGEPEQILCGPCHPVGCVAAEAEVAALQGGIIARVQEIADGLWPHGTEKRDRVADALAAVLCTTKDQQ